MVATRPSSNRISITALSSPVVRSPWTSVSPHANTLGRRGPCRTGSGRPRCRGRPCRAARRRRPSSASQKCAAWGPEWPSRARNVVSRPIAPGLDHLAHAHQSRREHDVLEVAVEDPGVGDGRSMSAASSALLPRGLVQATPLPWAAAARTASRCRWLGSVTTTRSTSGSAHTASIGRVRQRAEPGGERLAALHARAVVRDDPCVRHVAQPERWNSPMKPEPSIPMPPGPHQ